MSIRHSLLTCLAVVAIICQYASATTTIDEPWNQQSARAQSKLGQTFLVPQGDHFLADFMFYDVALGLGTSGTLNVATLTSAGLPGQILFSQSFSLASG